MVHGDVLSVDGHYEPSPTFEQARVQLRESLHESGGGCAFIEVEILLLEPGPFPVYGEESSVDSQARLPG